MTSSLKENNINDEIYGDTRALIWHNCCEQIWDLVDVEFSYFEREKISRLVKIQTLQNIDSARELIKSRIK